MKEGIGSTGKKPLYKKWWFWLIVLIIVYAIGSSIGGDGEAPADTSKPSESQAGQQNTDESKQGTSFTQENIDILMSNPKKYKGSNVEFSGKVFATPERDEKGTYLQVFADPINMDNNIIVGIMNPDLDVSEDSYVKVVGVVKDQMKGTNAFGAEISAPVIEASEVEVIDYITAVSPTQKTIELNENIEQKGFEVTVEKLELADNETRVYIKVKNNTEDNVSIWEHTAKLIQGSKQYESEYNYDADYPELQSDLSPGVETQAILSFKALDDNAESAKFIIEGSSDNYDIEIEPFSFEFELN